MALEQTWRWYGPKDPITLAEIRQTGATGIVTALHHIPIGEVWSVEEIKKRKNIIENAGLKWSVVESVPVHEDIKKQNDSFKHYIKNYTDTLRNLGECGIQTVCYNFMPVLDWSRTNVKHENEDGSFNSLFDPIAFAAFELFILKRPGADIHYPDEIKQKADVYYKGLELSEIEELTSTILQELPGSEDSFSLKNFQALINEYKEIDALKLKKHLYYFLEEIIPIAEKTGIRMAIHPDDPPWPVLGLPRIVSTIDDILGIIKAVNSPFNGITLCTGSLGSGHFNDLVDITKTIASRINFVHLRNVFRDDSGYFMEENHLNGDIDMYGVMKELLLEELRRKNEGRSDWQLPMRPDHGHLMLDDIQKAKTYPGYSLIGRMKGLAELRGLEIGIERSIGNL
ncbi:MAG: mannonate dehydratase [Bacteroidota bacterium]